MNILKIWNDSEWWQNFHYSSRDCCKCLSVCTNGCMCMSTYLSRLFACDCIRGDVFVCVCVYVRVWYRMSWQLFMYRCTRALLFYSAHLPLSYCSHGMMHHFYCLWKSERETEHSDIWCVSWKEGILAGRNPVVVTGGGCARLINRFGWRGKKTANVVKIMQHLHIVLLVI